MFGTTFQPEGGGDESISLIYDSGRINPAVASLSIAIPQTFSHLLAIARMRDTAAGVAVGQRMRVNGLSTNIYSNYEPYWYNNLQYQNNQTINTNIANNFCLACAAGSPANYYAANQIWMPGYREPDFKVWMTTTFNPGSGLSGGLFVAVCGGIVKTTSPITSLTVYHQGGSTIDVGSRFMLYGVK